MNDGDDGKRATRVRTRGLGNERLGTKLTWDEALLLLFLLGTYYKVYICMYIGVRGKGEMVRARKTSMQRGSIDFDWSWEASAVMIGLQSGQEGSKGQWELKTEG